MRIDIGLDTTGETPDFGRKICSQYPLYGPGIVVGDTRETRLDAPDTKIRKLAGNLEFLVGRKTDAYGLLAVSQCSVIKTDRFRA
jgi:hypothetical protein